MGGNQLRASQGALAALALALFLGPVSPSASSTADPGPVDEALRAAVAALRTNGDLAAQRRHVWETVQGLTAGEQPRFESWRGEGALYAPDGLSTEDTSARGMRGFARPPHASSDAHGVGAPVVTYTLYNPAAFAHIRRYGMQQLGRLEQLRVDGASAAAAFPADAAVIKTAWWPVAAQGLTAMPVWDGNENPPRVRGNPYLTWSRVVVVDPSSTPPKAATAAIGFMGRSFTKAPRVSLSDFHHVAVDDQMAERLSRDPESRRAAAIALGRPIAAGDSLALVGVNLMTHEQEDWVWAALWWHDRPREGPFAQGRPADLPGPWGNYLMQAAFDAVTPMSADGGPHVTFNPWLEARFPDGGQGGGTKSNCLACHQRASYPAAPFLPVTRGPPDRSGDPAFAADRVMTRFMWSIPMHVQP